MFAYPADVRAELRIRDIDVTRWEAYAAPFRVELDPALEPLLENARG